MSDKTSEIAHRFQVPGEKTTAAERQQLGKSYEHISDVNRRLRNIIAKHKDRLTQASLDLEDEVIALNLDTANHDEQKP